jgi:hypothetical protein
MSPCKFVYTAMAVRMIVKNLYQFHSYRGTYELKLFKLLRKYKRAFCLNAASRLVSFPGNITKLQSGTVTISHLFH